MSTQQQVIEGPDQAAAGAPGDGGGPASPGVSGNEALLAALEQTRSELAAARDELLGTVRSLAIDRALMEAGAMDVAAAREKLGDAAGIEPGRAVAALRAREPGLFAPRQRIAPGAATSGAAAPGKEGTVSSLRLALRGAEFGDRRALLEYMRLRRAAI